MIENKKLEVLHSAITHFVSEPVKKIDRLDDLILFQTASGRLGTIEKHADGNYGIWMGEELVYELEGELFDVIEYDRAHPGSLIEFYNHLRSFNPLFLQYRSKVFFRIIKKSVENVILNHELPLTGNTIIGPYQIYFTNDKRIKIILN